MFPRKSDLLILMSKVFGMIGHSEHLCEHLGSEHGAFWIGNFVFLFGSVFPRYAGFAFGL